MRVLIVDDDADLTDVMGLAEVRAQADALARVARLFLAVRDRANTPLQTLEFAVALLDAQKSGEPRTIANMQRALDRLHKLFATLELSAEWHGPLLDTVDFNREMEEVTRDLRVAFERGERLRS